MASSLLFVGASRAALVPFPQDLGGFTAAAGNDAVAVSFDDIADGSDVGGQSFSGAALTTTASPLIVIDVTTAASAGAYAQPFDASNRLIGQSGNMVISPGGAVLGPGPDDGLENDDLTVTFAEPVGYFGLDHLSQRADGESYTRVSVINDQGQTILDSIVPISSLAADPETGIVPGGADFWGVVSDANDIKTVIFDEVDDDANAADNNVGYDALRFGLLGNAPPPAVIPLPAAAFTAPALLLVAEFARRRMM